ncbi:MAG: T9SS type A sorting domain-containing protein [Bacteroidota bacterium]
MNTIFKIVFSVSLLWLSQYKGFAQSQVVFTSSTNDTVNKFWRVNVDTPFIFDNISQRLDLIAQLQGKDYGPVTVSHDGNWYAFKSERFDADAQGWAALTIINSDFSNFEVIHDSTGQVIHSEGIACVLSGGNAIVFVADIGSHNLDVFVIYKNGGNWGMPRNLTAGSTYNYNYCPYVSSDGLKVLFDAGDSSFPGTAIGEINIDGSGLAFPVTASSMPSGIAAHSPCYGIDGSIIYEGDASGERIWSLPNGSFTPSLVNASYGNDNSPVTLPDGRIASLWFPGSWHQIKIMNADGTNGYMLTDSCSLFTEIFDVGISACPAYTVGIGENPVPALMKIFPDPVSYEINISFSSAQDNGLIEMTDITGKSVMSRKINKGEQIITYNCCNLSDGVYIIKLYSADNCAFEKVIVRK